MYTVRFLSIHFLMWGYDSNDVHDKQRLLSVVIDRNICEKGARYKNALLKFLYPEKF